MSVLLWPLSIIYGFFVALRNLLFDWRLLWTKKVNCPVISIGNLSVGGSGKTPWVIFLSEHFKRRQLKVGIVSRGFQGNFKGVLKVSADTPAAVSGDEPLMLHKRLGCPVYVCRDRVRAANELCRQEDVDVIIMDDGFQHRWLERNVDIVIIDASWPLWKYKLLPMGRLRESVRGLRRATICVFNKWNFSTDKQRLYVEQLALGQGHNDTSIVKSQYTLKGKSPVFAEQSSHPQFDKAFLLCAIANPDSFVKAVKHHQIFPVDALFYPDHHSWTEDQLEAIFRKMKSRSCRDLIVTEKDKVKLENFGPLFKKHKIDLWFFEIELKILEMENLFIDGLLKRLEISDAKNSAISH